MRNMVQTASVPRRMAFAATAVALVVVLAVVLLGGGGRYRVSAQFDQVYGLIKGANVTAGGVQVGSVRSIVLGSDGYPKVTMDVEDGFVLHGDASASIVPPSVASEVGRVVELDPGRGATLAAGSLIPRSRTHVVQEFDQVLSTLDPSTRGEVRALLSRFDAATIGRGPDIARTLRSSAAAVGATADVAQELSADSRALNTLISSGDAVVSAIESQPGALGAFADQLSGLLSTVAAHQRQLAASIAATPAGIGAGIDALHSLQSSVGNLRGLVDEAKPGVTQLRLVAPDLTRLLAAAQPALAQVRRLVSSGPSQLNAIRPLLSTLQPVLGKGTPALSDAIPILNQTRARYPDAFGFFANWSGFFNNYDANGHGGRVGLVFTNPSQEQIGPSDTKPGILARPFLRDPGVLGGDPWTDYQSSFIGAGQ
jgi:phospholipid/cholesterol/gamma-HCH transport system substrate-binding protein